MTVLIQKHCLEIKIVHLPQLHLDKPCDKNQLWNGRAVPSSASSSLLLSSWSQLTQRKVFKGPITRSPNRSQTASTFLPEVAMA